MGTDSKCHRRTALNGVAIDVSPYPVVIGAAAYPYLALNFDGAFGNEEFDFDFVTSIFKGTSMMPYDCGCYSPAILPGDYTMVSGAFIGVDSQGKPGLRKHWRQQF